MHDTTRAGLHLATSLRLVRRRRRVAQPGMSGKGIGNGWAEAAEMVKARAIDGPVSCWWGLPGCNGTNQPAEQIKPVATPCGRRAPRRSVPFSLCRQPLPFRLRERRGKGNQVERAGRSPTGVGGTRGAVGSARQHVTSPHTHVARDPQGEFASGPLAFSAIPWGSTLILSFQ